MAKIHIALPVMGGFYPQMIDSLLRMLQINPGGHEFHSTILWNESLIPRARNSLAMDFLDTDDDYLLFIDADLAFPPDAADRLVRHDKDIVAAPYVVKSMYQQHWAVGFFEDEAPTAYVSGLTAVRWVSGGFTLIRRQVFETLQRTAPRYVPYGATKEHCGFFNPFILEGPMPRYLPEDWAFCERAREAGFDCFVDFDIKLSHYGTIPFQMREIDGKLPYRPAFALAAELDATVEGVGRLLDNDLQARMSKSVEELVGRFKDIQQIVFGIVKKEDGAVSDSL